MSNQNQESRLSTIRFSFPETQLESVKNMKIIGRDLLLYVSEEDVENVTQVYSGLGFNVVDRVFKLHASTQDEATFNRVFGNVERDVRDSSSRYIATITVDSKEEYDRLVALHGEDCVVKPFKARYSTVKHNDGDDQSDTNERVQQNRYQRQNTRDQYQQRQDARGQGLQRQDTREQYQQRQDTRGQDTRGQGLQRQDTRYQYQQRQGLQRQDTREQYQQRQDTRGQDTRGQGQQYQRQDTRTTNKSTTGFKSSKSSQSSV